jgi:site-specific DNA-methyltransferase (adenine-specific)
MKDIPDKSIDMILCDLPYGTTACKWDIIIPFEPLWKQYKRIIKDNRAIVLFGSEPFSSVLRMSNIKDYKYDWIWDKVTPTGFQTAKYKPMKREENIIVFSENGKKINWNPIKEPRKKQICGFVKTKSESSPLAYSDGKLRKYNDKNPQSILKFSKVSGHHVLHPTQKPVALFEYLIKTYTNEGELVLDNCMGSGTTGVACKKLNRNFIGIELDPEYFKIAEKRINENL